MSQQLYVPYFAINPYGPDVPGNALDAARKELETQLGCAWHVLDAKSAYEAAGGLQAFWRGVRAPAIVRWRAAVHAAAIAAYRAEQPSQATIEDMELPDEACIDVIAATRYAYSTHDWLNVFTAHFGMSDYCASHQEALAAGRHWLSIASDACPIAAADQEIRERLRGKRSPESAHLEENSAQASASGVLFQPVELKGDGVRTCNWI